MSIVVVHSDGICVGGGQTKKPTVTVKHVGSRSITISITPPADAVKSAVIKYMITYGKEGETKTAITTKTSVTLSNLDKNTAYQIGVRAQCKGGKYGPESDHVKVTTGIH